MKYLYYSIIFLIIMVGVPSLVNFYGHSKPFFSYTVGGTTSDWIGFYGGYYGAVIGGIFAFIIANYQIKKTLENDRTERARSERSYTSVKEHYDVIGLKNTKRNKGRIIITTDYEELKNSGSNKVGYRYPHIEVTQFGTPNHLFNANAILRFKLNDEFNTINAHLGNIESNESVFIPLPYESIELDEISISYVTSGGEELEYVYKPRIDGKGREYYYLVLKSGKKEKIMEIKLGSSDWEYI